MYDLINGTFEFIGALLICLSIRRLWLDGQVKGVSVVPVTFFASWGFWNLFFYPHLEQWLSFWGGVAMVLANSVWLIQMAYIIWVAPPRVITIRDYDGGTRCPTCFTPYIHEGVVR